MSDRDFPAPLSNAVDISIRLDFNGAQPVAFGAPAAKANPLRLSNNRVMHTQEGGSCNVDEINLIPHCNGTHIECVGHLTNERQNVLDVTPLEAVDAVLISIEPVSAGETRELYEPAPGPTDRVLTRESLRAAVSAVGDLAVPAMVIRTLPNPNSKQHRDYSLEPPPFFTLEAGQWLVEHNVTHLLVDIPSVDRQEDNGRLPVHRIFWGLPAGSRSESDASRPFATITELIFVPDRIADGPCTIQFQAAPFALDAVPARPVLFKRRTRR